MHALSVIFLIFLGVISAVYFYIKKSYSYFASRGVPHVKPIFPYGNAAEFNKTLSIAMFTKPLYDQLKGKDVIGGMYFLTRPIVLALDLEVVKSILIKDFQYFNDRGLYTNEEDDPLSGNLFSIDGKKWKRMRVKLTPTFTSGKMKFMFPTIVEVANQFEECLNEILQNSEELEIKDLLSRFTTDIIGTCAFGIKCHSLKDPKAEFREMGRLSFEEPRNGGVKMMLIMTFKDLARRLHVKTSHEDVLNFFMKVVRETVEYREQNNIQRNDFMDLLIKLKNEDSKNDSLTLEEIAAQAFVFFLAGFETSSTTMTFCLYELACNPDIQQRAREEIREVLKKHNGQLTYEAMMDMKYLDQVIHETLRKYPPVGNLTRLATADYQIPGTKHIIEKGTNVWIPVFAIQRDPEYYPDPERFNPDRFSPEETANRDQIKWLPFGDGPRNCIGLRFGMMQTRVGLAMLLNNFQFAPSPKTNIPLKYASKGFVLAPEGGIYLSVKKITT